MRGERGVDEVGVGGMGEGDSVLPAPTKPRNADFQPLIPTHGGRAYLLEERSHTGKADAGPVADYERDHAVGYPEEVVGFTDVVPPSNGGGEALHAGEEVERHGVAGHELGEVDAKAGGGVGVGEEAVVDEFPAEGVGNYDDDAFWCLAG